MTLAIPWCRCCGFPLREAETSCRACGTSTEEGDGTTLVDGPQAIPRPEPPALLPGIRVARRYRILAPLGWGGERAVYGADDLESGQAVALQFLPDGVAPAPEILAGWRRISHPNICQVLDLGTSGGRAFLVLEIVQGESLDALLRRIGRLPLDKGLEIARQLAAGLAAIHDGGALHGDLTPAQVILDGRGRVRLTGWGLPELTPSTGPRNPGIYEAPERLADGPVTVRSDLYSLAAILYEILTGRPASEDGNHEIGAHPLPPSALLREIDRRLDNVLLQCLERDPRARPASAKSLIQVLPGRDPLEADLAAGETPSPEMVAAAPGVGSLRPATGLLCLAGVVLAFAGIFALSPQTRMIGLLPLDHSTGDLAGRARSILSSLGDPALPEEERFGFAIDLEAEVRLKGGPSREALAELASRRSTLYHFWYRESPSPLVPAGLRVTADDPPRRISGEAFLQLDVLGRLQALEIVPPVSASQQPPRPVDWTPLFAAAGLDQSQLSPRSPVLVPPVFLDTLTAWQGSLTQPPEVPLPVRIEAGALAGAPLYFRIVPWSEPGRSEPADRVYREDGFHGVIRLLAVVLALLLSIRNLRRGRANLRWAWRLSAFVFLAGLTIAALGAPSGFSLGFWQAALGEALRKAAMAGLCYLGLESFLRRRAPETITSWSRVLTGSFRDPLVGRDVLLGVLLGSAMALTFLLSGLARAWTGGLGRVDLEIERLNGVSGFLGGLLENLLTALITTLSMVVLLVGFRMVRRRGDLGVLFAWGITTTAMVLRNGGVSIMAILVTGIGTALLVLAWERFGLLTGVVHIFTTRLILEYPVTGELSVWYAPMGLFPLVLLLTLAIGGYFAAISGQPWSRWRSLE